MVSTFVKTERTVFRGGNRLKRIQWHRPTPKRQPVPIPLAQRISGLSFEQRIQRDRTFDMTANGTRVLSIRLQVYED